LAAGIENAVENCNDPAPRGTRTVFAACTCTRRRHELSREERNAHFGTRYAGNWRRRLRRPLTLYEGINECVLSLVPLESERILDVGCGTGTTGERLRHIRDRSVVGITYSREEADLASKRLSQVVCAELNTFDFSGLGTFDCVILSHILEHLYSPEDLLERLKCVLRPNSLIVVALPNVVWWRQRLQFLIGRWRYQDWGILDRTHYRFFDMQSSEGLLKQAGYEILRSRRDGPLPLTQPLRRLLGPIAVRMDRIMCSVAPGLFAFQFVYLARIKR